MIETSTAAPLVGIVCDRFFLGEHDYHGVKHSYIKALIQVAGVIPVLCPATEDLRELEPYTKALSGVLFPGGASNVDPLLYGGSEPGDMLLDRQRDHISMALMRRMAERDIPVLAICRGFQEMNVAFGGTLDTAVHRKPGRLDHREDPGENLTDRYRYKHRVAIVPGGILSGLTEERAVQVNSLHMQGVDRLGAKLFVEARSPDELVEAYSVEGCDFALGVQWHPEVSVSTDPLSRAIFKAFGQACFRRAQRPLA